MNFCSHCGQSVSQVIPPGDNRLRDVCNGCGTIHYSNPNNVCGAILTFEDKVLLCKRAINPRRGLWTLPAGFMENGETVTEAAARESMEEANAVASKLDLFGIFSLPHISQVYIMFKGEMLNNEFYPGEESLQTELFAIQDIPWSELAFPVVSECLKRYIDDKDQLQNQQKVHSATAIRHPDGKVDWVAQ